MTIQQGSGGDFGSSSDKGTVTGLLMDAAGDEIWFPVAKFGGYQDMLAAARMWQPEKTGLPTLPRYLVCEVYAAFATASNDEEATGFGFIEDGGDPEVVAGHAAYISSNGTNFELVGNAAVIDVGAAVDTAAHLWRIEFDRSDALVRWYIDGTLQGSGAYVADEAPYQWAAHVLDTTGANDIVLGDVHIFYAY